MNTRNISLAEAPITKAKTQQAELKTIIQETIERYATLYGVDTKLPNDLIQIESSYCKNLVSKTSSARGCFMIIKSTWEFFGCNGDRMNIEDNIQCGIKILSTPSGLRHWTVDKNTKRKLLELGYDL